MKRTKTGMFLEALEPNGSVVDVLLIQAGVSQNRREYPAHVLREAVPLFEGARAFAASGPDHNANERGVKSLVGWYSNVRYVTGIELPNGGTTEGIAAHFNVLESASWLRGTLADALKRGKPDLVGFSIVGDGSVSVIREAKSRRPIHRVVRIDSIESVDVVVNPAAGGVSLRLVASKENSTMDWSKLTQAEAVAGLANGTILPDELKENRPDLYEATQTPEPTPEPKPEPTPEPKPELVGVAESLEARLTSVLVESALATVTLPDASKQRIRETTAGLSLDQAAISQAIKSEADYVAQLNPTLIRDAGARVVDMKDEKDTITESVAKILTGESNDSFRQVYVDLTGDRDFTGRYQEGGRLTESIVSSTFAEIMGDSITRAMLREYGMPGIDFWRPLVDVVPKRDFRTERRIRMGGYGDLPAVLQGDPYVALTSPTDEEATYNISKRGGTEDLTLEAIANDDLGVIRRIPRALGRAAARTLHKFVFGFISTNPVIYDGLALFVAGHNNIGTGVLNAANLAAGRLAMVKQTEYGAGGERLGISPKYLVVPPELEQVAYELTTTDREVGSANNTLNFARTFGLQVVVVPWLTDTNNWYLVASPADVPTIEIAFFNGREEPELFLQDSPTVGTVFSNDKLTWKIRHIYGGAVLDFRGFYGAIVP
jgi:hypothetical protein